MAGSVIDSLVVTLGLDSKEFAKGMKGSTEELANFTRRLAGMFLAVRGLEDVVGYFKDLHATLAEIGFAGRNLGVTGTELKRLGEVSELFGGQVSDAADSIQSLQASVFNLRYRGQLSESLMMLQRFGVAYLTASGHARNFKDVALDASKAIERQAKAAGLTQGERYQMALSFGFTGGIASAVAQGGKGLEGAMRAAATDQKSLTERTIAGQVKLDQDITRLQEATAAQSSAILSRLTPAAEDVVGALHHLADEVLPKVVAAIDALVNFFKNPPAWLKAIEEGMRAIAAALGPGGSLLAAITGLATALVSLPLAIAGALGILLGSLLDKVIPKSALDSMSEKLNDMLGPSYDPNDVSTGGSRRGLADKYYKKPPPTPTAPRPGSAAQQTSSAAGKPTAMASPGGGTQVHIDEINVNTRATDANGIAGAIGGAMQRKLLVANADQGQG